MKKLGLIMGAQKNPQRPKNLHTEFQLYGVYLAETLDDTAHYSLYIKMAKTYPRALLENALSFVKGSTAARSKGRLFMWKVKQLKQEQESVSNSQ